jgi:hypothetical protein
LDRVQLWALVNTVMKQVSEREGNFLTSWATNSYSRKTVFHKVWS